MTALRRILLVSAAVTALAAPAAAQTANPLATREAKLPAVITWLQSQGVKLTYLGEEGGLRGYIGESANGKMQTFYVTPDGQHVVAGILFRNGGDNVTGVQIGEMRARFDAASKALGAATVDGAPAGAQATEAAEPKQSAAEGDADAPADTAPEVPQKAEDEAAGPAAAVPETPATEAVAPAVQPQPAAAAQEVSLPPADGPAAGAIGNPSELWISKIDKAEFLAKAEKTPFFEVGTINAPATLWMVADPQCPYCHRAWDYLRPLVYAKKVKVRVILIAGLEGSDPIARDLLSRPLPARAWLDSNAGKNLKLEADKNSPSYAKAGEFLDMNMQFAKSFGVDRTPFLGYVAADGQFYSALGLPSDLDSFFAASGVR